MPLKIAFANDHAALEMRPHLLEEMRRHKVEVLDLGTDESASVDYPDFAQKACDLVVRGEADRAVLVCGTGIGISIAANKIKGIRCALCHDEFDAEMSRQHNDANALALRGRHFDPEMSRRILRVWLETPFTSDDRHDRRIGKIMALEG